jgi:uncharacterized membrane protein
MQLPFLNPWLLWALPAVGVPVLIHLLNRHRATTIEWGAMELLRKVMVYRSRQIRLEDVFLMAVRCAIVLLLVLAVARPTTRWLPLGGRPKAGLVVAIDGSLSMTHRPGVGSRFEEAVERARTVLRTTDLGQPVTIVVMHQRPEILLRHTAYDPATVEEALAGARPCNGPLDLDANLAELQGLVRELKAPRRELHIVTDAQITTYGRLSDKSKGTFRDMAAAGDAAHLVPIPVAGDENCGVTELGLVSGVLRVGALAQFQATVRNYGRTARNPGELTLFLNEQAVDSRPVERLEAGQSATVRFAALLGDPGINRLAAKLGADPLTADDQRFAVVDVRQMLRVLCVDGDPAERADAKPVTWVAAALSPTSFDRSETRPLVDTISWTALGEARLDDYDAVVLVNVADIPHDRAVALRKFVEQGGGLILFPGSNLKVDQINRRFLDPEVGLLPAEVTGIAEEPELLQVGVPLDVRLPPHPIAEPLRSLPEEVLTEARCYRHLKVRPGDDTRVVLNLGNGLPMLLEHTVGRGRILLWTSGIEPRWSNLAVNPAFPVLLQQAITRLTRRVFEAPLTVPQPILLPLPQLTADTAVEITDPTGQKTTSRTELRGGEVVLESPPTVSSGFHELESANALDVTVAVNTDARECDAKVANTADLTTAVDGLSVAVLPADRDLATAVLQGRRGHELYVPLLLAVIVLLAAEALLARRYTKRA